MQRKRTVNSLLIVMGVAFGLSFNVGKVSAADISVGDVVPVTSVDQIAPGNKPDAVDDEMLSEEDEPLNDEWASDELIEEEIDVEIGEAIAIERSADGSVTRTDLLAPVQGSQDDQEATKTGASKLGSELAVSATSSVPATSYVAASDQSADAGHELDEAGSFSPIVERGVPASETIDAVWLFALALMLLTFGLLASWSHFRSHDLQG
ncbi:MAG: hypothetical protein ACSLFB_12700 [Acidimicrobiales bacterium]